MGSPLRSEVTPDATAPPACASRARRAALSIGAVVMLTCTLVPHAEGAPQDPLAVSHGTEDAPIGASVDVVRKRLRDALEREYAPLIRGERDAVTRDRLKRELPEKQAEVDRAYEPLEGPRTPYDISILTGEFHASPGEGVLRQSRDGQDTYYLFTSSRLWKIVSTVAPHFDFAGAALRMTLEYGKPSSVEFGDGNPAKPPVRVQWRVRELVLELADRRSDFGCYTVLWADAKQFDARKGERVGASAGRDLDPLVQDAMEQQDSNDIDNIVDQLLKK